jgi:YVTN family beta-propeller protein
MKSSILWRAGVLIFAATVVLSACSGIASPTDKGIGGTVWVADEEGNSITVINAATNKVITTLNGIEGAHNLQVAPNGKTV